MIQKVPLAWSAVDAYERVLNQGVTLSARDRSAATRAESASDQEKFVVAVLSVETYSEVHPLSG